MSSTAERIKERLSIQDVVSSYIKLEKSGKNYKAKCPFHNEKTPSFFISPERNSYYCFGCGAKGDVFTFVQEFEGLDFMGALRILAGRAGVEVERVDPKVRSERDRLFQCLEEATAFFQENLSRNGEALSYLKERGLTDRTINDFRLGFARDEWRSAFDNLTKKGFTKDELLKAGLAKESERGGGERYYDTFRGRIIFPIFDSSGRPIAFSGRAFKTDDPAKYLNTPETVLFNKSEVLYGYDRAKGAMRKYDFCVLVEGQMDLILSHQAGYKNTVASSGTALTDRHLKKIKQLTGNIVLAFDADSAGVSSVGRGAHTALSLGMDVKVARLPKEIDPADLILQDSKKWQGAIREAEHIVNFFLNVLSEAEKDERAFKKAVRERVLPYVARIDNKIDQAHFVAIVSDRLGAPQDAVFGELEKIARTAGEQKPAEEEPKGALEREPLKRRDILERKLLGVIIWQESLSEAAIDIDRLKGRMSTFPGESFSLESVPEGERGDLAFEAELLFSESETLEEHVEEILLQLEEDYLKEKFAILMKELKEAEDKKDAIRALEILKLCQGVSEKLQDTKSKMQLAI